MNAVFARAALAMHGEAAADFQWVCQTVVTVAQQFVPGADHTLLMLRNRHGSSRVAAASDALAVRIGTLHHHYTEGPCVQSARTGHSVTVTDLARECRWSHITHAALAETPIRAVLAVPVARLYESSPPGWSGGRPMTVRRPCFHEGPATLHLVASLVRLFQVTERVR